MVGRVMKPHQLTRTAGGERLDARMHYTGLGDLSLSRLRYGATVRIEPGPLESFFLVQMPLCGTAAIESGGQRIDSSPELASVLSPECDTRMCWEAGNDQVMLRISRSLVERTLVGYLGHPLDKPLHFELAGARLRALELPAVLSGGLRHPISRPGAAQAGAVAGRATGRLDPADLAPAQLQRDRAGAAQLDPAAPRAARRITCRRTRTSRSASSSWRRWPASACAVSTAVSGIPGRQPHALSARPAHGTRAHRAAERRGRQRRRRGAALGFRAHGPFQQRLQGPLPGNAQTLRRH